MAQVFRIKHVESGLFSKGGSYPSFGAKGKLWVSRGALSNHLNLVNAGGRNPYKGCQLITYELTEVEVGCESMEDAMNASRERKLAREQAFQERMAAYDRERKMRQLAQLQKELGLDK